MSVEDDLGEERLARWREIRMGAGKVQTMAWRAAALIDALDIIDELVTMRKAERVCVGCGGGGSHPCGVCDGTGETK